jgi:hypothetical protein
MLAPGAVMERKVKAVFSSSLNLISFSSVQAGMIHPEGSPPFSSNAVLF